MLVTNYSLSSRGATPRLATGGDGGFWAGDGTSVLAYHLGDDHPCRAHVVHGARGIPDDEPGRPRSDAVRGEGVDEDATSGQLLGDTNIVRAPGQLKEQVEASRDSPDLRPVPTGTESLDQGVAPLPLTSPHPRGIPASRAEMTTPPRRRWWLGGGAAVRWCVGVPAAVGR